MKTIGICDQCGGSVQRTDTMEGPTIRCSGCGAGPALPVIPMRRSDPVPIGPVYIPGPVPDIGTVPWPWPWPSTEWTITTTPKFRLGGANNKGEVGWFDGGGS